MEKILFVGTSWQVTGLKAFIKKDINDLICVDLDWKCWRNIEDIRN